MDSDIKQKKLKKKSLFREYVEAFAIAILLALFIRAFIVQAFKIPSGSMKPTLLVGDHLLVNKFIYGIKVPYLDRIIIPIKNPKRGDVIVFKYPEDESLDYIKRVIGIEGDVIEIKNKRLYINGEEITSEYVGEFDDENSTKVVEEIEFLGNVKHRIWDRENGHDDYGPITVPENSVFVMGDNRDNSQDSRYWDAGFTFVSLNKVKGKALIIYWSWPHWGRFLNIIR